MKDPIGVSGCRWGFQLWRSRAASGNERSARDSPRKGFVMPVWMEVLLNVMGYAGFVGVATFNRSAEEPPRARGENVSP
jgi:hypothetical protein